METYRCGTDCDTCGKCGCVSRRQFLKQMAGGLAMCGIGALASACAPLIDTDSPATTGDATSPTKGEPPSYTLPTKEGAWTPPESHAGDLPTGEGSIRIEGSGEFIFDAVQVKPIRTDVFQPEHFSLFDILIHLDERGDIALDYHFGEAMDTHVIDAIDGKGGWWYEAYYSNGWPEANAFRMDMYPYKNNTSIVMASARGARLEGIYQTFREEVDRLAQNGGQIIIHAFHQQPRNVIACARDVGQFTDQIQYFGNPWRQIGSARYYPFDARDFGAHIWADLTLARQVVVNLIKADQGAGGLLQVGPPTRAKHVLGDGQERAGGAAHLLPPPPLGT